MAHRNGAARALGTLSLAAALPIAAACGNDGGARRPDAAPATGGAGAATTDGSPTAGSPTVAGALDPAVEGDSATCPKDGRWRHCSVADRLRRAGLVPHRRPGVARLPFLSVGGAVYDVSRAEVRAFVYATDDAARRDGRALDAIRVAPRGGSFAWPAPATLVRSGNLVAVILTENGRQAERLQLALEAGAPQPEGPATLPAAQAR